MDSEVKTKANIRQTVPFFAVSDMETSLRYYTDGLGFEMINKWIPRGKIEWCYLQRGGGAIMLQEFRKESHDPRALEGTRGRRSKY